MTYRLQDLIDLDHFQCLQDRLNQIYSFPSAIIDNAGNILTATAWQDLCTQFHRKNKECERECRQSDQYILSHLHEANPAVSYRCPHGLVDNATPIFIDGVHYGNFFTGQFFLEKPDLDFFRAQAKKYGFEEEAYLKAVEKVPIWTKDQLNSYLFFIKGLIAVISESGLKRLKEIETRKQIAETEESFGAILTLMHDGFWVTNAQDGRVIDANEAMGRLVGYSREELLNMSVADVEANDSPEVIARRIQHVIQSGSDRFESRFRRKNGTILEVEVTVTYLPKRNVIFGFHRDITERKRTEAEHARLEAQNRQLQKSESLGRMAGAIAHHFNNQLQATMMSLELAKQCSPGSEDFVDILNEALKSAHQAAEVSSLMLTYLGQTQGKLQPLDLSSACQRSLTLLRTTLPPSMVLETDLSSPGPTIRADANQIQQVLTNLVTNAWEAIGEGRGTLRLTVNTLTIADVPATRCFPIDWRPRDPAYACLEIADTGCGIAEPDIEKIFDPFFSTKFAGRGLGLPVVLGMVRAQGGAITVESEPGRGSVFRVFFPLSAESVPHPPEPVAQVPRPKEGGTMLLVEDQSSLRKPLAKALMSLGFTVLEATDGVEAVELFRRHHNEIRFVLSDLTMPRMNGWETLAAVRQLAPGIPFILSSGYNEALALEGKHTELPQAFLSKPYEFQKLRDVIFRVLASQK